MQWLNVVSSHPMESSAVHTAGLDVHFATFLLGVPPAPRIRVCLAFTEYSSYGTSAAASISIGGRSVRIHVAIPFTGIF